MTGHNRDYIKKIKIISGGSQTAVEDAVNEFLKELSTKDRYVPENVKIIPAFSSSETASSSYGITTHTMYVYTIEYLDYVTPQISNDSKGPTPFEGFKHSL